MGLPVSSGYPFVVWGEHPNVLGGQRIKIRSGSLRECRSEMRSRKNDGWTYLNILKNEAQS